MAIVAATIAAARNLFFIGARRKFSSVPKGMLVSAACQWRAKFSRGGHSFTNSTAQQALILRIGQHAIDSNRSEDEGECAKQAEQSRAHARCPQPLSQNLLHGLRVGERQILVDLLDLRAHGTDQRFRIAVGAHNESGERRVLLAHGDVGDRLWVFPDLTNDCGSHNTNNLEQFWFLHDREAFSEWFLARTDSLSHGFIDDGYASGFFTKEYR